MKKAKWKYEEVKPEAFSNHVFISSDHEDMKEFMKEFGWNFDSETRNGIVFSGKDINGNNKYTTFPTWLEVKQTLSCA